MVHALNLLDKFFSYRFFIPNSCPIFILHGTEDKIVPFNHGKGLFEAIPEEKQYPPFWAKGCGHNNIGELCPLQEQE